MLFITSGISKKQTVKESTKALDLTLVGRYPYTLSIESRDLVEGPE